MIIKGSKVWSVGALIAGLVAGCGGGGGDAGAGTEQRADVGAARSAIAEYTGKPTAFPVVAPLRKRPEGQRFAYLQCATPACGLFTQLLRPTEALLGYELEVVKAGASASALQSAMSTAVEQRVDGVLIPASDPSQYAGQMAELEELGIPVSANGITQGRRFGIDATILDERSIELGGRLLADWVVSRTAEKSDVAFYEVPELSFSAFVKKGFAAEMKRLCPACEVRYTKVPVATIGNSAPNQVSSDLQANPSTTTAVFASAEAATGLPAALRASGTKVETTGFGPTPTILQYIRDGEVTSGLGVDVPVMLWTQVDALARLATGQRLTAGQRTGVPPLQMLSRQDIDFDVSKGFSAYPDFADRFAKLWAQAR